MRSGVKFTLSIDNFIHNHRENEGLVSAGKLAIATCILKAEASSTIGRDMSMKLGFISQGTPSMSETWLGKLLSSGQSFLELCESFKKIDFVVFNYDRCIEQFLLRIVPRLYPSDEYDEIELINALSVIRPYGSLGAPVTSAEFEVPFGDRDDFRKLLKASNHIRTFTEGMESEAHNAIPKALSEAGTVLFLGYGFITQNDKFLYENGPFFADRAFATTFHMVDEKEEEIESRLRHGCLKSKSAGSQIHQFIKPNLRNETCAALVDRFSYVFEKMGRE